MRQIKILAVIAGVLSGALVPVDQAQAGDVYKYTDERGNTMYTDKPMPGAVLVTNGSQRPPEVAAREFANAQANTNAAVAANQQRNATAREDNRVNAAVSKDVEAAKAERCKKAREWYTRTIESQRLYREKEGGEREYLNEDELSQTRNDALKKVESACPASEG